MDNKITINKFDGLYNFRDIGGHITLDGNRMKTGVLFRSDELSRLSVSDMEKLDHLGIKLICDLRTLNEQKSKPNKITNKQIKIVHYSIYDQSQEFTRFEFFKYLVSKSNSIDFEGIMKEMYRNMAFSSNNEIRGVIQAVTNEEHVPALIHCTGGKDRTGFISAIIQLTVGVPYKTVMKDYLYSNELIGPRMKKIERFIRIMSLFQATPERIKPILEVREEYLDEVYAEIMHKYGNIETYLSKACNIPEESLIRFKSLLLEKSK